MMPLTLLMLSHMCSAMTHEMATFVCRHNVPSSSMSFSFSTHYVTRTRTNAHLLHAQHFSSASSPLSLLVRLPYDPLYYHQFCTDLVVVFVVVVERLYSPIWLRQRCKGTASRTPNMSQLACTERIKPLCNGRPMVRECSSVPGRRRLSLLSSVLTVTISFLPLAWRICCAFIRRCTDASGPMLTSVCCSSTPRRFHALGDRCDV